jgi:uncharacterized protein DUF2690
MSTRRSRAARVLVQLVVGSIVAACALIVVAPGASAAACWDTSCDGQDPQATGCSGDAYTLTSADIWMHTPWGSARGGTLEVRFSPSCQAQWTRLYVPPDNCNHYSLCPVSAQIWRWAQGSYPDAVGGTNYLGDTYVGDAYSWSAMVGARYASAMSEACMIVRGFGGLTCAYAIA